MKVYHYTCRHGRRAVLRHGQVRPFPQRWAGWARSLAWFTHLSIPTRDALGLVDLCDKTAYRFTIRDTDLIVPWSEYKRELPGFAVEAAEIPGALPDTWYVSEYPVDVDVHTRMHEPDEVCP